MIEVEGDLIELANLGAFDVILHGCNCFCAMKSGIAPQMAKAFGCNEFRQEHPQLSGDINKLGTVDYRILLLCEGRAYLTENLTRELAAKGCGRDLAVVNCYTQYYHRGNNPKGPEVMNLDYSALVLCLKKINHLFKGKLIGMPKIGSGKAGGNWNMISKIIEEIMVDCKVTIVNYKKDE